MGNGLRKDDFISGANFGSKGDGGGLLCAIVQDDDSSEVLLQAWMDSEALALTVSSGQVHFYSRSRKALWRKGESSGNVMTVVSLALDCDGDCILARVSPAGPACHTGRRSCFFQKLSDGAEL